MRRAKFIMAAWLILFNVITAPFLHTHVRVKDDGTLPSSQSRVALVHAHFHEAHEGSSGKDDQLADFDHSSNESNPFVLLALLPLRSPAAFLEMRTWAPAPPAFIDPLIVPLEHVNSVGAISIHDPPGLRRLSLRAPPAANPF